jgi:transposase
MPWIEETKVEQRLKFVTRVRQENISIAKACREFGISRPTGYKWLKRYDAEGLDGLEDRSRAPDEIPHKTDEQTEEHICALRASYPSFGSKNLRAWLCREHPDADWPAASTIGDILKRNGMIEERSTRSSTPPASSPLAEADAPNRI